MPTRAVGEAGCRLQPTGIEGLPVPPSGLLRPLRQDRTEVDATFELASVALFELVFHHKAGARDSPRSVNADYHEGLELLLDRLALLRASILAIEVDSGVARDLPRSERELDLEFPIELTPDTPIKQIRLDITRAQRTVARRPTAKAGGGNDQKRIRLTLTLPSRELDYDYLLAHLVGPI